MHGTHIRLFLLLSVDNLPKKEGVSVGTHLHRIEGGLQRFAYGTPKLRTAYEKQHHPLLSGEATAGVDCHREDFNWCHCNTAKILIGAADMADSLGRCLGVVW
jgi:hypothetical protein